MAELKRDILPMDSPDSINMLTELFRDIAKQELAKAQFNRMIIAKVISADNVAKTASVQLINDGVTIDGVKNRCGESLNANDLVYILLINSSSSNFAITIKC